MIPKRLYVLFQKSNTNYGPQSDVIKSRRLTCRAMCVKKIGTSSLAKIVSRIGIVIGLFLSLSTNIVTILYFDLVLGHFLKSTVIYYYRRSSIASYYRNPGFLFLGIYKRRYI